MNRLAIAAAAAFAIAVLGAVIFGGPVVRHFQAKADRAEARAETQTDQAAAAGETLAAERNLGRQAVDLTVRIDAAQARTDQLKDEVHADPDGEEPLPDDSVDRLRRHDAWLCEQGPQLCPDRRLAPG